MVTLLELAARTTSGNSGSLADIIKHPEMVKHLSLLLDVSAAATDVGDTLNVYVQTTYDGGTTWDDFVHFTEIKGNGGVKEIVAEWYRDTAPESDVHPTSDAEIAVGVVQGGKLGTDFRVKWVIVDADVDCSFTFSVKADPFYR